MFSVGRIAVLSIFLASLSATAQTYDLSADFSLKKNPKGVWRYGYSSGQSLAPAEFRLDQVTDGARPIGFWHPEPNQGPGPGYYPYVAFNTSKRTEYGSSNGWAARAGEVAMEASNVGQYSIVRFRRTQERRLSHRGEVLRHPTPSCR